MLETKIMSELYPIWDKMTLCERKSFIARECSQLTCDFCDARDVQGINSLHRSLELLIDFVDTMTVELECSILRDSINEDFKAVQQAFDANAIDEGLADNLAALAENVRNYAVSHPTECESDQADEDAYANIKAAMEQESIAVGE